MQILMDKDCGPHTLTLKVSFVNTDEMNHFIEEALNDKYVKEIAKPIFADPFSPTLLPEPRSLLHINVQKSESVSNTALAILNNDKMNVIEREDIVTLVKILPRDQGASVENLIAGHEYRVMQIYSTGITLPGEGKITRIVNAYDIVDDINGRPERIRVHPTEVALLRKRKPPVAKGASKIEEILACPHCQALNACYLDGNKFKGSCEGCKGDYVIERIIEKCPTDKCLNDVALFLYGDLYKGKCNRCGSIVEAEHAD